MLFLYFFIISLISANDELCNEENCLLPSCQCIRIGENPTWLEVEELPQLISLSFVGEINNDGLDAIRSIFNPQHRNPNKCPISGTFFVEPEKIDTCLTQRLFENQHEIAMSTWKTKFSKNRCSDRDWNEEFDHAYRSFVRQTTIHSSHFKGFRLNDGRIENNTYLRFLKEKNFHYDSSMLFKSSAFVWPFTLNFPFDQETCLNCLKWKQNVNALWEFPIHQLFSPNTSQTCRSLIDGACSDSETSQSVEYFYNLLMHNFERHSSISVGQRCPWIIELDFSWLSEPKNIRLQAIVRFIKTIVQNRAYSYVYFVSIEKALEWMKNPRPIAELSRFWPFICSGPIRFYTNDCLNEEIIETSSNAQTQKSKIEQEKNGTNVTQPVLSDLAGEKLFPSTIAFHILWIFIVLLLTVLFYDRYFSSG